MGKNINPDVIDKVYHEKNEYHNERLEKASEEFMLPIDQYSDICVECQKRHYKTKGFTEGRFPVTCKGIPRRLVEERYYPLEEIYGDYYDTLRKDEKILLQFKNNPLLWAEKTLNWSPYNPKRKFWQFYQEEMLLCTALKKAGRLGRRMGKSEILVVKAIHFGMTSFIKNPQILIIAPFMNLCDELFQRAVNKLDESAYAEIYSSTKKPYKIEIPRENFGDVCTIRLYTTGSSSGNAGKSTRGQRADMLIIDEGGYVDQESLETVLPLLLESSEVELIVTSTPSQVPNKFKEWCLTDRTWKDFYFPFTVMPGFVPGNEEYEEFKTMYGIQGWKQEIEAEFFEGSKKVFKEEDIKASLEKYIYPTDIYGIPSYEREQWRFIIGVDWNSAKHGVQISLLGINLETRRTKLWKRISIKNDVKQLQSKAVEAIIDLDKKFGAEKIVVDAGYGAVQIEMLIKFYQRMSAEEKIVPVDFSSTLIQEHPMTKEKFSKRMKCVMVSLLQQRFEYGTITISSIEEGELNDTADNKIGDLLTTQLNYYEIEKYDNRDNPVFKAGGPGTDHALDSLLLANYGINRFIEEIFEMGIGVRPSLGVADSPLQNFLNDSSEKVKSKFTNNELRENFSEVYSRSAMDKEQSQIMNNNSAGRLNKLFGTRTKRLNRKSYW